MDHIRILDWAEGHLKTLQEEFKTFWYKQPSPTVLHHDDDTGEFVGTYYPRVVEIDERWIYRIGDTLHNMRVALDYLAFHIVNKHAPGSVPIDKIQFPIFDDSTKYRNNSPARIGKALPSHIQDAFERIQPYHAGRTTHLHRLWMLHSLENVHKHRRLLSARPAVANVRQIGRSEHVAITKLNNPNGRVLDKPEELYRYRILSDRYVEDDMKMGVSEQITFGEPGMNGMIVPRVLESILDHIRQDVFVEFQAWV